MTRLIPLLLLATACTPALPDRHTGPEAAFVAARMALKRHDLPAYYDALTDVAVRETLSNSISICLMSGNPEVSGYGFKKSVGCESILKDHGWIAPDNSDPTKATVAWRCSVRNIAQPRQLAAALETNHRATGAGTSFVWDYLDPVTIKDITIEGRVARATVDWAGEAQVVAFELDSSGWRFTAHPDVAKEWLEDLECAA